MLINIKTIKYNISKIIAITEKNIKLKLRFKFGIILGFITPILSVFLPIIIMGEIFEFNNHYGPWTSENFIIYQLMAYNIILIKGIMGQFPGQFMQEKFWQTLPGLIIAPTHRINYLFGIIFGHLITISIPFIIFFILTIIFYPVSFLTIIFILGLLTLIVLVFSGIGIIIGVFTISNENISILLNFGLSLLFLVSCITYPFELFPENIQNIVSLNPLFYLFDILRLTWIENNIFLTISSHIFHFVVLVPCAIIFPILGAYIFNIVYKKYGIVGA